MKKLYIHDVSIHTQLWKDYNLNEEDIVEKNTF